MSYGRSARNAGRAEGQIALRSDPADLLQEKRRVDLDEAREMQGAGARGAQARRTKEKTVGGRNHQRHISLFSTLVI